MGAEQSQLQIYKNGFDEVETKVNWKSGLIVDVRGQQPLVVVEIKPLQAAGKAGTLRIEDRLEGDVFIYTYVGRRIIAEEAPVYEIVLKPLDTGKIGGGSRQRNGKYTQDPEKIIDELLSFDEIPNLTKPTKFTVRTCPCAYKSKNVKGGCDACGGKKSSADGKPHTIPRIDYPVEHPDDNIADDESDDEE